MNKESIYKIIGYNGEYSPSIKKNLKKLLKENHPDHNGDKEIFKLINEVKKELELNQVSFKIQKNKKSNYNDIDYDYCQKMINKNKIEKNKLIKVLEEKKKEKEKLLKDYRNLYYISINNAHKSINNNREILNRIKNISILLIIILLIIFLLAIIKNNIIIFIFFGIMCFISIIIISKYFSIFNEVSKKSEIQANKYANVLEKIKNISLNEKRINEDILILQRKVKKVENDLRFYNNLLK